jgi:hypothetical protein
MYDIEIRLLNQISIGGKSSEGVPAGTSVPSGGGTCAGDIRLIQEGTLGFWHKFYQGPKGGMRWGIQYSYITKSGWSGAGSISPKAVDNMVFTSFRYYLPYSRPGNCGPSLPWGRTKGSPSPGCPSFFCGH